MDRVMLRESHYEPNLIEPLRQNLGYEESIRNPYDRATTSRATSVKSTRRSTNNNTGNTLRGAARRKLNVPKRDMQLLKTIMKLQNTTNLLIPRAPFARLIREISMNVNPDIVRYTVTALQALQEATEMFLVQILQDSYVLTMHRKCVTLTQGDMLLIRSLKYDI